METVSSPEVFLHIKVVMGMVISLSLARVLTGVAGIVQHPGKAKVYAVHLGWALSLFPRPVLQDLKDRFALRH